LVSEQYIDSIMPGLTIKVNIEYLPKKITADYLIYVLVKETVGHSEFIISCSRNFSERRTERSMSEGRNDSFKCLFTGIFLVRTKIITKIIQSGKGVS